VMTHVKDEVKTGTRRKRDPKGTRERLVRAALDLFTSQGYHASTTPQLAAKAGIAEGTIYRHFDSKEQLLNEIYRAAVRLFTHPVRGLHRSFTCHDSLFHVAAAWQDLAQRNPPLIKLVFSTDLTGLLDSRSRDAHREFREELEKVIAAGKSSGEVRAGSVEVWTDVWLRLIVLVLERTASKEWTVQHSASQQVFESAWDAIRSPS
jgi:AcrR family transcriptional regulator